MSPLAWPLLDPAATPEANRTAFRRWALRHHPDHGGDPVIFAAGVARYRVVSGPGAPVGPRPRVVRRHTSLSLLVRWARRRRIHRVV